MADLPALLDGFDRLVAAAEGTVPPEVVTDAARTARRLRARRGYLGDTVLVALAGGTGSGKSSLVNALAGEEVAAVGSFRPTTSEPLAWIPADPEPGLVRLLDDLGIDERVGQDAHDWLAVLDLPDTDSVEAGHRATVARLLPEVDAVVWVVDPEKYQDRILHAEHLAPLAAHADQFVFALNQIDRVREDDVPALVQDLRRTLAAEGIEGVAIVPLAADPALGDPVGIDDLLVALRGLGEAKALVRRKIVTDVSEASARLAQAAGVEGGAGTGFAAGWESALAEASGRICDDVLGPEVRRRARRQARARGRRAAGILPGRPADGRVDLGRSGAGGAGTLAAIALLDRHVDELARRAGGEAAGDIRRVGASVDGAVSAAADTVVYGESLVLPEPPGWAAAAGWFRRLALVATLVVVVWLGDAVRTGAPLLGPVSVLVVALAATILPGVLASARAERAAAASVDQQRHELQEAVSRELDRRLGRPLREALHRRAGVSAALAELEIIQRELVP